MTTVFHARVSGRFIEIQRNLRRKKFIERIKATIFLEAVLAIGNVRASIQFRTESEPQQLKRRFSLKNRPINFHINSTSVVRPVKRNQLSFSSIEINKPFPSSVQCLVDQIQVQNPILVVATDQMPDHTYSREYYHQHR